MAVLHAALMGVVIQINAVKLENLRAMIVESLAIVSEKRITMNLIGRLGHGCVTYQIYSWSCLY
jgi:hypothetical protein